MARRRVTATHDELKEMTMTNTESLKLLFPTPNAIPHEHRLVTPIHQRTYLVGGAFRAWDGECKIGRAHV